jgi:plasmid maintenance system killer protein
MITGFRDEQTELVYRTGAAPGVPDAIAQRAVRGFDVIHAAACPADARIVGHGRIAKLPGVSPTRFGVHLGDQWWITFGWESGNASDVCLEKRT